MYDSDVFVVFTAHDQKNRAGSAFELEHNSKWLCKATGGVALEPTINSRETTPAEHSQFDEEEEDEEASAVDRLVVSFEKLLALDNLQSGLQLGTNPLSSHVLLGHRGTRGISGRQCNITVDEALNIWLHDYSSTHGTAVGQNGQNQKEVRRKETWLLAFSPDAPDRFEETTIHCSRLAIRIEFPNQRVGTLRYVENLRVFVKKCQEAAARSKVDPPGIQALGLDSGPPTQAPSEAPTPRERLVYYEVKNIGAGEFGHVLKIIKARDGKVFAAKIFNPPPNRNKRRRAGSDKDWLMSIRKEFALMRDNPHPNVIQVFELRETPEPAIIMAYCAAGNIVDAGTVDDDKYVSAWGQILDGLSHLHAKGVVHRDLKPENILIERNPLFKVMIADFGMAKVVNGTTLLHTFCGSLKYTAPEVFPGVSAGHGPPVDIWSLGIIAFEWIYGSPDPPEVPIPKKKNEEVSNRKLYNWLETWVRVLLDKLQDQEDDRVIQILVHMIEIKVTTRWSASQCLAQGFKSGVFKRRVADGLVTCASDPDDVDFSTVGREDGTKTPTAAPSLGSALALSSISTSSASGKSVATIVNGAMWGGEGSSKPH